VDSRKLQEIKEIEGHLLDEEIEYLFEAASNVGGGCIVEIGNFRGKSTVALTKGAPEPVDIFTIDPHKKWPKSDPTFGPEDRRVLLKNLLDYEVLGQVRPIDLPSGVPSKGWNDPISFLFVDGDHSYCGCKRDFLNWHPHVEPGGMMAFHDANKNHTGVPDVIDEALEDYPYEIVEQTGGIKSLRKIK